MRPPAGTRFPFQSMNDEMLLEMQRHAEAFERLADATELQNALLIQIVHELERDRAERHPDPEKTAPSHRSIATDVVDKYGDLYGGGFGEWEFDPIAGRVGGMGDRGD